MWQIEFTEPSLHFLAPGDLDDEETDDVIAYLQGRCDRQEKIELSQLTGKYLVIFFSSRGHATLWGLVRPSVMLELKNVCVCVCVRASVPCLGAVCVCVFCVYVCVCVCVLCVCVLCVRLVC